MTSAGHIQRVGDASTGEELKSEMKTKKVQRMTSAGHIQRVGDASMGEELKAEMKTKKVQR
ncbi:unnamed protein product [Strongylus vulgaris]|uniref:Uncharacterized protein n=1 Tax=Strongylus vulgaris TaxID=40348 RepID=A0A3P7K0U4_STRVU|nr:unnamed protein product [Strongylus vulgaris]